MVTKKYLRQVKCEIPGCQRCDHRVFLHSKCHPKDGATVFFDKQADTLVLSCKRCGSFIVAIDVVEGTGQ